MSWGKAVPALAYAVSMLVAGLLAAPAGAATAQSGCRASAVRASFQSPSATFEPTVANASTIPCSNGSDTKSGPSTAGPMQIGASAAFTHLNTRTEGPGAGAFAFLTRVSISTPSDQVVIDSAQAQATYACNAHTVLASGSSEVAGLSVEGKQVLLPDRTTGLKVPVGTHGSYVLLNQTATTASSLTRTAALVHLVGVGDFVIAEAVVNHSASACGREAGVSATVQACPTGSSYDAVGQTCVITAFTKRPIVVGQPFQGPTGGKVLSLAAARATFTSPCLRHRGPSYAVIGVPGTGPLIGTAGADRLIAFSGSYQVIGSSGNDCIDVAGGNDIVHDGNGKGRIFAGAGSASITVGNGKDFIHGGPGADTIKAGNGNDRIIAGAGITKISAGNGDDHVRAAPGVDTISLGHGNDTIVGSLGLDEISAGRGKDKIFLSLGFARVHVLGARAQVDCGTERARVTVNPAAVGYAKSHGCLTVIAQR